MRHARRLMALGTLGGLLAAASPLVAQELEMLDEYTAFGQGESRATNSITLDDLEYEIPGLSLEKTLDAIPGVNVTSSDPFGFYEFGNDIRIRSFDISKLAVTVDDVPMGNNSPRYGTPVGRVADPENMGVIKVSQGTGDVTTAATEALGGSIMYTTRLPSKEPSGLVKVSTGSFDAERMFARYDTGEIFPGFTSYVSASRFRFKSTGVPDFSESKRIEFKGLYEFDKGSFMLGYTWNDRDDFDTRTIQWDRWRAMETGEYSGTNSDLRIFAANGYANYTSYNTYAPDGKTLSGFLLGDYSDNGRRLGPLNYLDPDINLGDDPNSRYYLRWRNGRQDHFVRTRLEYKFNDEMELLVTPYYQRKYNYGLFPVSRGDSRIQIQNAYLHTNRDPNVAAVKLRSNATTGWTDRPDIWPEYLFHDGNGNQVPIGTPGAVPVSYIDVDEDGFYTSNDTLDLGGGITFSPTHALAMRGTTFDSTGKITSGGAALNGATARDEDFGAERYGTTARFIWKHDIHQVRVGFWYEQETQHAYRPTYMLEGDSPFGAYLYDRVLFLNYDQEFDSTAFIGYLEYQISLLDDALKMTVGNKYMDITREATGQLTTPTWWRNATATRKGTFTDEFLPQVGVSYRLARQYELFSSYAENLAAPQYGVVASDTFTTDLLPEQSKNFDFGVRYSGGKFNATVAGFVNKYEDRILSIPLTQEELVAAGLSGVTGVTNYRNVGGITAKGAEIAFDWRTPIENLVLVGSLAYQVAEFDENLVTGTTTELTEGKSLGNTPEITTSIDLRYSIEGFRFNLGGKYFDSVYVNTLNTEEIPSYTIFNASIAYAFAKDSTLDGFSMTLTVDNLFDEVIWYAAGYNGSSNGSVRADYGRNITFTVQAAF